MTMPTLPNLHDAILERLHLDWAAATAAIELHPVPGAAVVLIAYGVRQVDVDRLEPWGPSVYVNTAEVRQVAPGQLRLRLEMQSGDDIIIVAEQFELTHPEPGASATTAMA